MMDVDARAASSDDGSAITVGTSEDAAIIRNIEDGSIYEDADYSQDDTKSLTSSIRQHIVEGGFRYHAYHAGKYAFPNDEHEQYRDDLKHSLTLHLCDGAFFFAPIHDVLNRGADVLDLGTGTGKWVIDMADEYENSTIQGMDLSPIQPDWVPENAMFVVDDIEHEAGWTQEENSLDYIHVRHTLHSIRNRQELWDRAYKHLKPGGYVEVQEFAYMAACDDTSCDGPYAWREFLEYLRQGLEALGSDLLAIRHVEGEIRAAGFEHVELMQLKCPVGPWAKKRRLQECGHILRDVCMEGLAGLARKPFGTGLGWKPDRIELFLVDVRKALTAEENGLPKYHSYFPFYNICARKPLQTQ